MSGGDKRERRHEMRDRGTCEHMFMVTASRNDEGDADAIFPIVVCAHCMTRWNGHLEQAPTTPPTDALISSAVRDAVILGQDQRALRMLKEELGLIEEDRARPNCMVGMGTGIALLPGQSVQVIGSPQLEFMPTHFLVEVENAAAFLIQGMRVGSRAIDLNGPINAGTYNAGIPGSAFASSVQGSLVLSPGETINSAIIELDDNPDYKGLHNVDLHPFTVNPEGVVCEVGMQIFVFLSNASKTNQYFRGWFLGRHNRRARVVG